MDNLINHELPYQPLVGCTIEVKGRYYTVTSCVHRHWQVEGFSTVSGDEITDPAEIAKAQKAMAERDAKDEEIRARQAAINTPMDGDWWL